MSAMETETLFGEEGQAAIAAAAGPSCVFTDSDSCSCPPSVDRNRPGS